jgi:hypothetical protein
MNASLIYDGSTGRLVRDGASTQRLVYVRWHEAISLGYAWGKFARSSTFAAAKSGMEAAAWGGFSYYGAGSSYDEYEGEPYTCQALASRFDMNDISMTGETAQAFGIRLETVQLDTSACRIGIVNSADAAPTDAWTWLDTATSKTTTAAGWLGIHHGAVLARYVWVLLSMYPYAEPAAEIGAGEYFLPELSGDLLRVYF